MPAPISISQADDVHLFAEWGIGNTRLDLTVTCLKDGVRQKPSDALDVAAGITGALHEEYGLVPRIVPEELTAIKLGVSFMGRVEHRADVIRLCSGVLADQFKVSEIRYSGQDASGPSRVTYQHGESLRIPD